MSETRYIQCDCPDSVIVNGCCRSCGLQLVREAHSLELFTFGPTPPLSFRDQCAIAAVAGNADARCLAGHDWSEFVRSAFDLADAMDDERLRRPR